MTTVLINLDCPALTASGLFLRKELLVLAFTYIFSPIQNLSQATLIKIFK